MDGTDTFVPHEFYSLNYKNTPDGAWIFTLRISGYQPKRTDQMNTNKRLVTITTNDIDGTDGIATNVANDNSIFHPLVDD